jgi:hypothetical protein
MEARMMVTATGSVQPALHPPRDPERRGPRHIPVSGGTTGLHRARSYAALLGAAAVIGAGGCGAPGQDQMLTASPSETAQPEWAWFKAGPAPGEWRTMELPDGTAVLSIPPGASPVQSDPGSVSAGITASNGDLQLYLNATPRQGDESQANWPDFRLAHLRGEHAASATRTSSRNGMSFRGGTGSCVADSYVTSLGAHEYREIACLVAGTRGDSVLVVAARADAWDRYSPLIEQAVDSYLAE